VALAVRAICAVAKRVERSHFVRLTAIPSLLVVAVGCSSGDSTAAPNTTVIFGDDPAPTVPSAPTTAARFPHAQRGEDGYVLAIGETASFDIYAHCGVKFLGRINEMDWVSPEPGDNLEVRNNWLPAEWNPPPNLPYGSLTAEIRFSDDGSTITATYNGRDVVYEPIADAPEELTLCD